MNCPKCGRFMQKDSYDNYQCMNHHPIYLHEEDMYKDPWKDWRLLRKMQRNGYGIWG